jgi:Na+/H+ antiporter NhaD/arsenite permease-like protein
MSSVVPVRVHTDQAFHMGFAEYTKIMLAPTLVAGASTVALLYLLFRSHLSSERLVISADLRPSDALRDRQGAILGGVLLLSCLLLLSLAPMLNIPLWSVTLVFALVFGARNLWVYPFSHSRKRPLLRSFGAAADSDGIALASAASAQVDLTSIVPTSESAPGALPTRTAGALGPTHDDSEPGRVSSSEPESESPVGAALTFMDAVAGMPWNLVPFVLGMFILVESLTASGFIEALAHAAAGFVGMSPLRGVLVSGCACCV